MGWFFDNFGGAWQNGTGGAFERGMRFTISEAGWVISKLRWYRQVASPNPAPTALRVWDTTTSLTVIDVAVPDNGAVGWQAVDVVPSFTPVVGREYRVSTNDPAGHTEASNGSNYTTPPTPFTAPQPARCYHANGGYPDLTVTGSSVARDVYIENTNPPSSNPATDASVANILGRWLDPESVVQYPASDPGLHWESAEKVRDLLPGLDGNMATVAASVGLGLGANVQTLLSRIPAAVALTADLLGLIATINELRQGANSTGLFKRLDDGIVTLTNYAVALTAQLHAQTIHISEFPTGWVMADSTPFVGDLAWNVPAQLYVVNFTAWPASNGSALRAGVTWLPRIGWWSPLNGTFAQDRRFLEFVNQHLHLNGARIPGLLLAVKEGSEGTVQAWNRP